MYILAFVVGLVLVIMFHEFGHFATAKAFGMKVEKFFLGFGPTLWSFQKGETEYGVKAIPAGGFVKIVGMSAFEDVHPGDQGRTFYEQAAWKRAIVLAAGSATHFIVAAVLLFVGLVAVGPPLASNRVEAVVTGSPAGTAGVRPGDEIVAVAGEPTRDFEDVRRLVAARPDEPTTLTVERADERQSVRVVLESQTVDGEEIGFLGVRPAPVGPLPIGEAAASVVVGDLSVPRLTVATVQGIVRVFSPEGLARFFASVDEPGPRDPEGPISPVGVADVVGELGARGEVFAVLLIIAQLNIVLGTMNLLPLPPLDGGHLAVLVAEKTVNGARRRLGRKGTWRLDPSVLTPVALAVILLFVVLSVTAIYLDVTKPVSELLQ